MCHEQKSKHFTATVHYETTQGQTQALSAAEAKLNSHIMFLYVKRRHSFTQCQHLSGNSSYQGLIMQVHTPTTALISTDSKTSRISQLALQRLILLRVWGRYEKRMTFLSKQEEYSLIFRWWASFWCLVVRVSGDSHVAMLSLALGFGPLVLFLLQTFGHLQVLLHQAALVDVGCQVALDWKRKGRETWCLDAHFEACLIQV